MQVTTHAPGRVCLLGDKVDLLGRPVIAAAISKFFRFNFKPINEPVVRFHFHQINQHFERDFNINQSNEFFKFFSQISWVLKDKIGPFECNVEGDLPIGAGLSSSAACSVGFINGLNKLFDLKMQVHDIAELAYKVEHNDLGIMCGRMDQYSIAYGGITFIETGDQTTVTYLPKMSIPLIIGDSCEPRKASSVLNFTMDRLRKNDPHFLKCFDIISECVSKGLDAIKKNDLIELGLRMSIQQSMEKAIYASTKKLDAMCDAAIAAGALGAKQIGAGGGGCMIALCPNNMDKVMQAVKSLGANVWKADIYHYNI
ncbi:hypothetical protein M9Y10_001876 [Tritrichomonas musculus]|uniref:mevalonate kinase n=1 Tax=Tritrichomonas musculus TaxID=1915356 RepID=A0ABR2L878_9EUKA